jgi:hypothetical protein
VEGTNSGYLWKKKQRPPVSLVGFLNKADDAYMLAFESKNIKPFAPFADPAVCTAVLQEILSGEDRYFGASKLRKRSWDVILSDGRVVRAVKNVGHEPINCGRGISIPLGDTVTQVWDVLVDGVEQFKVIKIGRAADSED